jgi:cytochrome c-type biogenesis protein CcmF
MTLATLGTLTILVLFIVCVVTVALGAVGAHGRAERVIDAAVQGVYACAALSGFASALIVYAFVSGDYSIQYVQKTSDSAMPLFYKITSFWGGLDGSLLFWVLLLSVFSAVAVAANRRRHADMIAHVVTILAVIDLFFVGLLVFLKNPFEPYLVDVPSMGRGLNPLLQNAYMVVHPPSLYLGYVSLAVPYAFGMAALMTGQVDSAWQSSVRKWSLFSWLFLTVGLVLGGLWAYEELGWGGYWAWDPVENAGLLPWFTVTAFLHSIMVQERRGMLRVWNVVLVVVSFWLSIVGTFMTRSGVVQSVHAFGEDPQLAWTFGVFIAVILVFSFGLVFWRLRLLRARAELESLLSREFAFVANNWMLLVMSLFVLCATLYPTVSEWTGTRVTIGPPFFERVMVPLGLALLLLMGVGPLLAWRKTSNRSLQQQFMIPLVVGAAGTILAAILLTQAMLRSSGLESLEFATLPKSLVFGLACFGLCAFTVATIAQEFVRGVAAVRKHRQMSVVDALLRLFMRARRRYGGYIVHLGVVLMFFGWAGNTYKLERKVNMRPGDAVAIGEYVIRHGGLRATEDWQKEVITADVEVRVGATVDEDLRRTVSEGRLVSVLHPARRWYLQLPEQPTTEVSRYMALGEDVYVSIQTVDLASGWTQMRLFVNPLVNWIWLGTVVMLVGGLICLGTRKGDDAGGLDGVA